MFSVVVLTMWRAPDVFQRALRGYIAHNLVDEVIVINNDKTQTPDWAELSHPKVRMFNQDSNIKVNPGWNLGVTLAKHDKLCIANDDIEFDTRLFDKIYHRVIPELGAHGIITGEAHFNQPPTTDGTISFIKWNPGDIIHCFGQLMFVHKANWIPIRPELQIYFGDDTIFHYHLYKGLDNYLIYNINFYSPMAATTSDKTITAGVHDIELPFYQDWAKNYPIDYTRFDKNKRILIAIPTNRNIEVETFKSIYDLDVPAGYVTEFQYFYGYQIDQIRNLIAEWGKRYDYLFCVDSDIVLPKDTLVKMVSANKDIISGLYIQRKPDQHTLEIYRDTPNGGVANIPYEQLKNLPIVEVAACGMGCCLINSEVLRTLPYPHFVYRSALNHSNTFSEDIYFCLEARKFGFKVWADPSIHCEHIGSTKFIVHQKSVLEQTAERDLLPPEHAAYLKTMAVTPAVVYDIGACVLHWTRKAKEVWPEAKYYLFDATESVKPFHAQSGLPSYNGVLTDSDNKLVEFYENLDHPGGNSYYRENSTAYNDSHKRLKIGYTLDTIVKTNNWPLPDLIKMDVQGAELDVLRGAQHCLAACNDIILEAQHVDYNLGAPKIQDIIDYMSTIGFELISNFTTGDVDGDYHFKKANLNTCT
jgi:FkbM family methyltransferase